MPPHHAAAQELRQFPPFAHLSKHELRRLDRLRTNIPVRPGKVLARQGHPCLEFGIVVEGTALVTRDGHEIALLEFGQHFGELGMVRAVPNPVTIVACTAVTLEVMSVREFRSAYTTMPALRDHIDHEIDRRIATWLGPSSSVPAAQRVLPAPEVGYTLAS
jgi:CRP-like cAMP-binding protein